MSVLEQDKRNMLCLHNVAPGDQHQSYLGADYKPRISGPIPHFRLHFVRFFTELPFNHVHKALTEQIFPHVFHGILLSGIIGTKCTCGTSITLERATHTLSAHEH